MVSLLRRKRAPTSTSQPELANLRISLSLPDLTTPLLDPSSWEEIPDLPAVIPSLPNIKPGTRKDRSQPASAISDAPGVATTRGRSPSLVSGPPGSPVAFHKPFGSRYAAKEPPLPEFKGDFRLSTWSKASEAVSSEHAHHASRVGSGISLEDRRAGLRDSAARRRKKGKGAEVLNVMLAGGKGVGKTSFLNLLRESVSAPLPVLERPTTPPVVPDLSPVHPDLHRTPSSPTSPGPPMTPSLHRRDLANTRYGESVPQVDTILRRPKPTTSLSVQSVPLDTASGDKLNLRVIDTPGLDLLQDDGPAIHARQRDRGMHALIRVAEERFEEVLKEESKVVRRHAGASGDLIHLCLYLLDARTILHPLDRTEVANIDWSSPLHLSGGEHAERSVDLQVIEPRLSDIERNVIRQLASRMHVLPVISHTDALSIDELDKVKDAVRRYLGEAFEGEVGSGFGIFGPALEAVIEAGIDKQHASPVSTGKTRMAQYRPHTPDSTVLADEARHDEMPYAIFCPRTGSSRRYLWGHADIHQHSDFDALRDAIVETHAKILRSSTREVLYERYRTEKLLARQARGASGDPI